MTFNDEQSIKKHIKTGNLSSLYFVYGDENYLASFYANSLASSITDTTGSSFNYYYFNSDNLTFDALYEACETLPVMSNRVCIFVKDCPLAKLNADELNEYIEYFPKIPDTATVIFLMDNIEVDTKMNAKWKQIVDAVNKFGIIFNLSKRSDSAISDLLVRSASKRGASISKETAQYLISIVGSEMNVILNEFDKICAYSGGNEITREMIDTIAVKSVEASVFDITKSINSGKGDRAFEILTELIKNKEEPVKIIGALTMEYVDMYRAKSSDENNGRNNSYLESFSSYKNKSYRLEKASRAIKSISLDKIKKCIGALTDADIKIKSFSTDNNIVLEELLARLIYITGKRI